MNPFILTLVILTVLIICIALLIVLNGLSQIAIIPKEEQADKTPNHLLKDRDTIEDEKL